MIVPEGEEESFVMVGGSNSGDQKATMAPISGSLKREGGDLGEGGEGGGRARKGRRGRAGGELREVGFRIKGCDVDLICNK